MLEELKEDLAIFGSPHPTPPDSLWLRRASTDELSVPLSVGGGGGVEVRVQSSEVKVISYVFSSSQCLLFVQSETRAKPDLAEQTPTSAHSR